MATKKSIPKQRSKNEAQFKKWADELFAKLENEPPVLDQSAVDAIEDRIQRDWARRMALAFLAKPFKEMADRISEDRDAAVALATAEIAIEDAAARYKALSDFLTTAKTRMMVALCSRSDMQEIRQQAEIESAAGGLNG